MSNVSDPDFQHQGTVSMLNLDGTPLPQPEQLLPVTWERVGPETVLSLSQAMALTDASEIHRRFARGCRCYMGKTEHEIVTYGWVTFDEEHIGEIDLHIRMQTGEAYIWDCATLPAYRGLRLYPALLAYILKVLAEEGLRRIWIGTDEDNVASQKGMALAGFRPIIDICIMHTPTARQVWIREREGIPEQDIADACQALIGAQRLTTKPKEDHL